MQLRNCDNIPYLLAAASVDGYHVNVIHMLLRLYLVVSGEQVLIFGYLDALYVF